LAWGSSNGSMEVEEMRTVVGMGELQREHGGGGDEGGGWHGGAPLAPLEHVSRRGRRKKEAGALRSTQKYCMHTSTCSWAQRCIIRRVWCISRSGRIVMVFLKTTKVVMAPIQLTLDYSIIICIAQPKNHRMWPLVLFQ
jgi:hypothetical protein